MRRRLGLPCAVLLLGGALVACVPEVPPPPPQPELIAVVNEFRAAAHVLPVVENRTWSHDAAKHARYMAHTGVLGHSEDPGNPYFTQEGHDAATQSNVAGLNDPGASDRAFVELWMTAPFHAVGILDPRLRTVGYGAYRNPSTPIRAAAALNVLSGLDGPGASNVVTFPGNGATVGLTRHGHEWPNPLTGCPGYGGVAGLPLIVMFPSAEVITGATLIRGAAGLEVCAFDGTSYTNPDSTAQHVARTVLSSRNAAVLVPREPLVRGATYRVTVVTSKRTLVWSFSVR